MFRLIDEQLEDMEKSCRLLKTTTNDPFYFFEHGENVCKFQRRLLPTDDD